MKRHIPAIMTLLMAVLLCGLGFWQLQRLDTKNLMLIGRDYKLARPLADLPADIEREFARAWDFRHVRVTGRFLHDHQFLLKPRVKDGVQGFDVVTPLRRADGSAVFVNRGFATDKTLQDMPRPAGTVTIEGLGRLPRKGLFTPDNDAAAGNWYWADTAAMAEVLKITAAAPVLVYVDKTVPEVPNNHLQYAFFWFGMAGVLVVIYTIFARRRRLNG